jgi:hypothetical protein
MSKTNEKETLAQQSDYQRYEELLSGTRDHKGVEHKNRAIVEFAEELSDDGSRIREFALSRAVQVAKRFDEQRAPLVEQGHLALGPSTYFILGDNERIRADKAKAAHTIRYLDILAQKHAESAYSFGVKDRELRRVLALQQERGCSAWQAQQLLKDS